MKAPRRASWGAWAALLLTGCAAAPNIQPIATGQPTLTAEADQALPPYIINEAAAPAATPEPTQPPAPTLALPGPDGTTLACDANTARYPLSLPSGTPAEVITRLEAADGQLLLIVQGGLYSLDLTKLDESTELSPLLQPGQDGGGRPIQELADLAYDASQEDVFALDKAGHVYRYSLESGRTTLAFRASTELDSEFDPQLISVTLEGGTPLLLDTAAGAVWAPQQIDGLRRIGASAALCSAADLASIDGDLFALDENNTILRANRGVGAQASLALGEERLGLALKASRHLGVEMLVMVDALGREVLTFQPDAEQAATRHIFQVEGIGLLRDAAFSEGRLYAAADGDLLVHPSPRLGAADGCGASSPQASFDQPRYFGQDALSQLQALTFPVAGAELPPWGYVYPGARRLYRVGIHHGIDLYQGLSAETLGTGTPVRAMQAGRVELATLSYPGLSAEGFEVLSTQAERVGYTSAEALDRFSGRRVILDHGDGLRTVYAHLDSIAPGVYQGAFVQPGELIGTVGVTGTLGEGLASAAAPHLHFEIWFGERYLGYGITLRETMWWYQTGLPNN